MKSKFQPSVNDLKSTWSKLVRCVKLTFACNLSEINVFNGFYLKSAFFCKVARCKGSIFCGILSEITVVAVTC